MKRIKKTLSLLIVTTLCLLAVADFAPEKAYAATSKYITIEEFANELAKEIGLEKVSDGSVEALKSAGIIREDDFKNFKADLKRGDATMLLSRADDYLFGDNIKQELIDHVIERRISDIGKISKSKREDVAKGFIKGFMKGYSNGLYAPNRELRGTNRITRAGALNTIKMIKDKSLRALISPDGQLLRTTKLPKDADKYPYILASFPNSFYDEQMICDTLGPKEIHDGKGNMTIIPVKYLETVARPIDIDKISYYGDEFLELKNKNLQMWEDNVRTHLELVFNVDYRTIGDEWVEALDKIDYRYTKRNLAKYHIQGLYQYIEQMKANKTIVESEIIATDKSTLYFADGDLYMKAFVKFRIVSSEIGHEDVLENQRAYQNVLHSSTPPIILKKVDTGEWRELCFSVSLGSYHSYEPETIGVIGASIWDSTY